AIDCDTALRRAAEGRRGPDETRFLPLEGRLARIFGPEAGRPDLAPRLCEIFLAPIFTLGRVYEDALPLLESLKSGGYRTAIVSNAPFGSPPEPWRRELKRLGLAPLVDRVVMCGDVGWRKPAPQIFQHVARELGAACGDCVFVGDDLVWDIAGSRAAGMQPILVDRDDLHPDHDGIRIRTLEELAPHLGWGPA